MASSLTFTIPCAPLSRDKIVSSFPLVKTVTMARARRGANRCRAMAVVKFKGTLMRQKQLSEMIEKKVLEAKEVCDGNYGSDECKVAWDEVEEVSQAKADLRRRMEKEDPLESFCQENPETDECRIYEE